MDIKIEITRKKIKNIILKVTSDGRVLISAPTRVPQSYLKEFIKTKENWIVKKLEEVKNRKKKEINYESGEEIIYLGKKYYLEVINSYTEKIVIQDEKIYIYCLENSTVEDRERIFKNWVKIELGVLLKDLTYKIGKMIGYLPNEIRIRDMKTRWGSCISARKVITYNLQLAFQPLPLIEYVVLHELAHIPYPNHQKEFWNFVEKFIPDWKERRKLLNKRDS
ncbi:SprT family zinc-dependent metalloprotease [Fusobacterium sp.]|uniref:M48 family metallopeptidase n=1 Tax=Fusobacterium sp. TaxID=68766 RepID=UPI001DA1DADC|nr:SprT family zinc-dependent metalloprotease [Fusobacterium sp.]MBS5789812.1 M48 family metallopeptidase [Fusobacterium sp.]